MAKKEQKKKLHILNYNFKVFPLRGSQPRLSSYPYRITYEIVVSDITMIPHLYIFTYNVHSAFSVRTVASVAPGFPY